MIYLRVYGNDNDVVLEEQYDNYDDAVSRQENLLMNRDYAEYSIELEGPALTYYDEGLEF